MAPRDANWVDVSQATRFNTQLCHCTDVWFLPGPSRLCIFYGGIWPLVHSVCAMASLARTRSQNRTASLPATLLPSRRRWPQRCRPLFPHNGLCERNWSHWKVARGECRCGVSRNCSQRSRSVGKADSPHHGRHDNQLVPCADQRVPHDKTCGLDLDSPRLAPTGAYAVDGL